PRLRHSALLRDRRVAVFDLWTIASFSRLLPRPKPGIRRRAVPGPRHHCPAARFFAALRSVAIAAVDGSSTGTEVPWMWVLSRPPRFGGAKHASGHDNWSRHRQVGFSNPRS